MNLDILAQIESKIRQAMNTIIQLRKRVQELEEENRQLRETEQEHQVKLTEMLGELEQVEDHFDTAMIEKEGAPIAPQTPREPPAQTSTENSAPLEEPSTPERHDDEEHPSSNPFGFYRS